MMNYKKTFKEAVLKRAKEIHEESGVGLYAAQSLAEQELTQEILGYILTVIEGEQ